MKEWLIPFSREEVKVGDRIIIRNKWELNKRWELENSRENTYVVWMVNKEDKVIRTTEWNYVYGRYVEIYMSPYWQRSSVSMCGNEVLIDRRVLWKIWYWQIVFMVLLLVLYTYLSIYN